MLLFISASTEKYILNTLAGFGSTLHHWLRIVLVGIVVPNRRQNIAAACPIMIP